MTYVRTKTSFFCSELHKLSELKPNITLLPFRRMAAAYKFIEQTNTSVSFQEKAYSDMSLCSRSRLVLVIVTGRMSQTGMSANHNFSLASDVRSTSEDPPVLLIDSASEDYL